MRICKIWDSDYPWDVRVEKVASALQAAGHEVHLVARNRHDRPVREVLHEATVHRISSWSWLPPTLNAASMFPAFFNPRWFSAIHRAASSTAAELILVRDLPLAPTAIWVGRRLGVPVVLDMAENYAAMMQSLYDNGLNRPWDYLVRNTHVVRGVERWVMQRVDHTLVVVEESRDRLVAGGTPRERITVVGNTPSLSRLDEVPAKVHGGGDSLKLIYLGLLEKPRGLEVVLRGVAASRDAGLKLHLTVIGDGRERKAFEAAAADLGLDSGIVDFRGFVPYAQAVEALREADVGLVPHLANDSWNTTIPNKLFDYMACGIAVLTSDAKPAARVVKQTGAGEVYADRDPADLAAAIARLADVGHRSGCGARGRAAVAQRYNFSVDGARLIDAVESVVAGRP